MLRQLISTVVVALCTACDLSARLTQAPAERAPAVLFVEQSQADVTMAPAADMFEMGVRVQVLKRGTMFPMRAAKLYELYRQYPSWEAIPAAERVQVEKTHLRATFDAPTTRPCSSTII